MRADFYRPDDPDAVVAVARLDGMEVAVESDDTDAARAVRRIFRPTPLVVDDGAYRHLGARGEAVLQPGGLEWFEAAALHRAEREGLRARIVPEVLGEGGWDPASAYRTFRDSVRRIVGGGEAAEGEPRQPGESAPAERAREGEQPRGTTAPQTP